MKKIIKMSPYLIINFFVFYLSPLLIRDTGGGVFVLLMEIPGAQLILIGTDGRVIE